MEWAVYINGRRLNDDQYRLFVDDRGVRLTLIDQCLVNGSTFKATIDWQRKRVEVEAPRSVVEALGRAISLDLKS